MDHAHVSYKSRTMVLLLAMDLESLSPYTAQKLGTHSYGVHLSYMWYTKQLLFSLFHYSGLVEM